MVRFENRCCNCATEGYPCMGRSCHNVDVLVYYCDVCNGEIDPDNGIYEADGKDLCADCLMEMFKKEV